MLRINNLSFRVDSETLKKIITKVTDFVDEDSLISFNYDDCPMYIFKEEIGVEFYLQYKEERDYSEVKEFVDK